MKNTFSQMIKKTRKNNALTMEEFAESVGVKKSTVSMWENNDIIPRNDVLMKISKIYKISIDELLGNEEHLNNSENSQLQYIQRGLQKMDDKNLLKAEEVLKAVFNDIFEDEDGDEDDI